MCTSDAVKTSAVVAATVLTGGAAGAYFYYQRQKKKKGGKGGSGSPPDVKEPPKSRGRNQELAVKTAKAAQKRRLALLGFKRFLLTSGRGDPSVPTLGKKALLGS